MDRGTYAATSGGLLQMRKLEIVNNNLANVNTVGFKRQYLTSKEQPFEDTFAEAMSGIDPYAKGDHERTPGAVNIKTEIDFSQGAIRNTGNPLDVALTNPNDFFVVAGQNGQVEYTRAGNFTLGQEGQLVTQDGFAVSGDGGAISVSEGVASISTDGTVRVNNESVGRLQVVRFDDPHVLEAVGNSRFKLKNGTAQPQAVEGRMEPQALEMANVSVINNMIDLIVTNRAFDAYTKASQTIDSLNQMAISQVGRRNQ